MSGQQRHREPVDVHLILRRDKEAGAEILLSRRAGDVYASGQWHLASGHLDGPHEDVVDALIREAAEEAGVSIDAAEVRFAVAVHHRSPGGKDFRLRNILHTDDADTAEDDDGFLGVIDLERSEPGPAVRDLVRMSDAWAGRPELFQAFLTGYGRTLTGAEEARLVIDMALDSVSGIAFGSAHDDREVTERGLRTLRRLRTGTLL